MYKAIYCIPFLFIFFHTFLCCSKWMTYPCTKLFFFSIYLFIFKVVITIVYLFRDLSHQVFFTCYHPTILCVTTYTTQCFFSYFFFYFFFCSGVDSMWAKFLFLNLCLSNPIYRASSVFTIVRSSNEILFRNLFSCYLTEKWTYLYFQSLLKISLKSARFV